MKTVPTAQPMPFALGLALSYDYAGKTLAAYYPLLLKGTEAPAAHVIRVLSKVLKTNEPHFTKTFKTIPLEPAVLTACISATSEYPKVQQTLQAIEKLLNKTPACAQLPTATRKWQLVSLGDAAVAPHSVADVYLRLTLISMRKALPHSLNLTGIFSLLPNVAWSNYGPFPAKCIEELRLAYSDQLPVFSISHLDKFPYMVNFHIPANVRIADGARVRLGAYCGAGTTVMPAGYVNFNAGTSGSAMIEGRISAGVMVGEHSDVGGGGSIMGTLSGGGKQQLNIAASCLIGANAGTGISLGFGCTIAAGVYVTAGAKVSLYNSVMQPCDLSGSIVTEGNNIVKAQQLSGREKLLFYQDSRTGRLSCKPNPKTIALNPILHKNS